MGISADGRHARSDDALFRQEDVFDADAADFKVMRNAVLLGKIADDLGQAGRLDILVRREVVGNQGNLGLIENRLADLIELCNGRRSRNIVGKDHIEITSN